MSLIDFHESVDDVGCSCLEPQNDLQRQSPFARVLTVIRIPQGRASVFKATTWNGDNKAFEVLRDMDFSVQRGEHSVFQTVSFGYVPGVVGFGIAA